MIVALRDELRRQTDLIGERVPAYAKLMATIDLQLTLDPTLGARLDDAWRGRTFSSWYDRPLLLLAAVRFEAAALDLAAALESPTFWRNLRTRSVQTNEVSRAVAWLWPCELLDLREVVLVDLGCSAGLNLVADSLDLSWIEDGPAGPTPLVVRRPTVIRRVGYDLKPGDVHDDDAMAWLRACVWPGQTERMVRLEAAISAAKGLADRGELTLHKASLVDVPGRLDADLASGEASHPLRLRGRPPSSLRTRPSSVTTCRPLTSALSPPACTNGSHGIGAMQPGWSWSTTQSTTLELGRVGPARLCCTSGATITSRARSSRHVVPILRVWCARRLPGQAESVRWFEHRDFRRKAREVLQVESEQRVDSEPLGSHKMKCVKDRSRASASRGTPRSCSAVVGQDEGLGRPGRDESIEDLVDHPRLKALGHWQAGQHAPRLCVGVCGPNGIDDAVVRGVEPT